MRINKENPPLPFQSFSGKENMAIDEFLINRYRETNRPHFRIYSWNNPTITLGRYQDLGKTLNWDQCRNDNIPMVRRITGGGSIYHDKEITYSLVCSPEDIAGTNCSISDSFELLNQFLMKTYKKLGLPAEYSKYSATERSTVRRSPFCFSGNEEYDILINGKKIGGNAQRRFSDIILQHGSIPIKSSDIDIRRYFSAPVNTDSYTFIQELIGQDFDDQNLVDILIDNIQDLFKSSIQYLEISSNEKSMIDELVAFKYGNDEWNLFGKNYL